MTPDFDAFRTWLTARGTTDSTATTYISDVRVAIRTGGFSSRLQNDKLAPKTRQRIASSLRQWAAFTKDDELKWLLADTKLPLGVRVAEKLPLPLAEYHALIARFDDEVRHPVLVSRPTAAVLGMLAGRGFRVGDVLRIRKLELATALISGELSIVLKGAKRCSFPLTSAYRHHVKALAEEPGTWLRVSNLISGRSKNSADAAARRSITRALTAIGVRMGIFGLHPHRLRRTYAVEYLKAQHGNPEGVIRLMQHMGWPSVASAMEYLDHPRDTHEIDDFMPTKTATPTVDLQAEVVRLRSLINTPRTDEFFEAVRAEAAHQIERWGTDHDAGKDDSDWFWLLGYLGGKALRPNETDKKLHRIIATAAACLNWFRHASGIHTAMRPGIEPPAKDPA